MILQLHASKNNARPFVLPFYMTLVVECMLSIGLTKVSLYYRFRFVLFSRRAYMRSDDLDLCCEFVDYKILFLINFFLNCIVD